MQRVRVTLALLVVSATVTVSAQPDAPARYRTPPQAIVDILDAPPLPDAQLSPTRDIVALLERRAMPPLAELAQPMLRLAGSRIDPDTNGPHRQQTQTGLLLKRVADGSERRVALPAGRRFVSFGFAADGRTLALGLVEEKGVALWLVDVASAEARAVPGAARLNAMLGAPCEWLDDGSGLVCRTIPDGRPEAPRPAAVPEGPNVQTASGKAAPVRTYQDLLASAHDEALFEHYAASQITIVPVSGAALPVGRPGLVAGADPSPDGRFLLVTRLKRPFSRVVPWYAFAKDVEIWSRGGAVVRAVADVPVGDTVPITGVITGPRSLQWDPSRPARLVWAEALDGGNLKNTVPHRDRLAALEAPFSGEPVELLKTQHRYTGARWTDGGLMLVNEFERPRRWQRTWIVEAGGAGPRLLWDRSTEDAYGDPGRPVTRPGRSTVLQNGSSIYLAGAGSSPAGDRPFLDRLDLATLRSERLFHCDAESYEEVVALVSDDGSRILTRRESPADPPNYVVRTNGAAGAGVRALTTARDPAPLLRGVDRRRVTYKRPDGVELSATLYLPPGYNGGPVPLVMWAYPQEFTSASAASQVTGSTKRFLTIRGASHLLLLTQGYAILDDPAMPIVGPGETANDTYVEQLVANATAAVEAVVALGVADRTRIGIGGHSYGAFMTANLLAHSDLFRMGIARSGAYNRSLTPFGFQAETRTFWEVPDTYARMSPFWYAHRINEPILLIHGEMDDNSGTFPVQSDRLFAAIKGHGGTARYVTLPYEAHGYAGRESVLHTVAEMVGWADKYLKATPAASSQEN